MTFVASLLCGVLFTSLMEYVIHRLMHLGVLRGRKHAEHHRDGWGQGFWPELADYLAPGMLLIAPSWFCGSQIAMGWTLGCVGFSAFIAYAHQLQHDNPTACRWMRIPVHYVHHRDHMWHHNFGMAVDWWDRVFGTYKVVAFGSEFDDDERDRGPLAIQWGRAEHRARGRLAKSH
jgi:sterol desaturase/sphingolipid hydroxylase (fatty acid hydroxylase superfamily)